jgi:hypothetical protein
MASLAGATIATTFKSLLKLAGNTDDLVAGASGAGKQVMTGDGESTPIYLNTDRVGIGAASPAKALHISGAGEKGILVTSTDNDTVLELAAATTEGQNSNLIFSCGTSGSKGTILYDHHGTPATQKMQFKVGDNNVTAATILGDGKVGIGTAAPTSTLSIQGDSSSYYPTLSLIFNQTDADIDDNESLAGLLWQGLDASLGVDTCGGIWMKADGDWSATDNDKPARMEFFTESAGGGTALGTPRMTIDKAGNVGIGATSPLGILHIGTSPNASAPTSSTTSNAGLMIERTDNDSVMLFGIDSNSRGWLQCGLRTNYATQYDLCLQPAGGHVGVGTTAPGARLQIKAATEDMLKLEQDGDTFTGDIINVQADVSAGSGWRAFLLQSNVDTSTVTEAKIDGNGVGYFHASPVSLASDYAEYFESSDGSAISLGTSVVLVDGKVRAASSGETPFGVVSSTTGNGSAWNHWDKRFIKTDYNAYDLDENGHRKQNPDYVENLDEDGEQIYVSREDRDEWNSIGLLGQVPITKGQPVASSWIKMWEISDSVDMYYIFPSAQVTAL